MKRLTALMLIIALLLSVSGSAAGREAYARTPLPDSANMRSNIELAASSISGMSISYGDSFSFNNAVGPRSEKYGYAPARNGRGTKVVGGGVAQVATTLYQALTQEGMDVEYTDLRIRWIQSRDGGLQFRP